jgi:hypothetical protein
MKAMFEPTPRFKMVGYSLVSTTEQGRSGLGLRREKSVPGSVAAHDCEAEMGKRAALAIQELWRAIAHARRYKPTLVSQAGPTRPVGRFHGLHRP